MLRRAHVACELGLPFSVAAESSDGGELERTASVVLAAIYATAALLIICVVGGHFLAYRAAGARKQTL